MLYTPSPPEDGGNLWTYKAPFNLALAASLQFPVEKWGTWSSPDDPGSWQRATAQRNLNLSAAAPTPPQLLCNIPHWPPQTPDDSAVWSGAPRALNFKLLLPRPVAVPDWHRWANYDDASVWTVKSGTLNFGLLLPKPAAVPARWNNNYDDYAVWSGRPGNLNVKLLLPPPVSIPQRWNWTPDDSSVWRPAPPLYNVALISTLQFSLGNGGWDPYDEASFWGGAPVAANNNLLHPPATGTLPLTTFVNPRYNAIDDSAAWQWQAPYNINIAASISFPVEKWGTWSSPDDAAFWVGSPRLSVNFALNPPATKTLPLTTFVNPRYNAVDDHASWQYRTPYNLPLIASLEFIFPGTGVSYLDDASFWTWTPPANFIVLNPPTATPVPDALWRPRQPWRTLAPDEQGNWQYRPPFNLSLAASLSFPVEKWGVWSSPDEPGLWQGSPNLSVNLGLNPPGSQTYFFPLNWKAEQYGDDAAVWTRLPGVTNFALLLPKPTAIPKLWTWTPDDAAAWSGAPVPTNTLLLLPPTPIDLRLNVSRPFRFGNDDPFPWQWRQPGNCSLYPPAINVVLHAEWLIRARRRGRR